jgi:tetratricopeptide (TPR) repeat protein
MHFTAQLVGIRRQQGRLDDLLSTIERLAQGDAHAAAWRSILPLAYLDAGDRTRARAAYDHAMGGGVELRLRTMLWLTAATALCEAAASLGDADGCATLYGHLVPYAKRLVQWGFTGNAGSVQRVLGRAAAGVGRRSEAREHFEAALARHAELRAPALLARTQSDYGELLLQGTQDERRRGRRLLCAADAAARRLDLRAAARA